MFCDTGSVVIGCMHEQVRRAMAAGVMAEKCSLSSQVSSAFVQFWALFLLLALSWKHAAMVRSRYSTVTDCLVQELADGFEELVAQGAKINCCSILQVLLRSFFRCLHIFSPCYISKLIRLCFICCLIILFVAWYIAALQSTDLDDLIFAA